MASNPAVPAARPPASIPASAPFPSLVIRADGFEPQGSFAEAQAIYLQPDPDAVARLDAGLRRHELGVVAHFYMDAELQGALRACAWPHVHVADSLQMADRAVKMAQAGVKAMAVLGVDFMSENVSRSCRYIGRPRQRSAARWRNRPRRVPTAPIYCAPRVPRTRCT
jgi:hypothetical protein